MIPKFNDARDAFFTRRLGMFIHFGLYSIPAWHEQDLWRRDTKRSEYELLMHQFNPMNFNPDAWIDAAESAGMEFICITAKHHDGFCLFNTQYTEYNIMNTPYGKDLIKELADACARRGMKLGIYYSIPDWHHPNYPNQGRHHQMFGPRSTDEPDEKKYFEYAKNQVYELMTNYGPICQLFWDVNVNEWYEPEVNEQIRRLQPGILINDRGPGPGDFDTPERNVPDGKEFSKPTQGCSAFGRESWGYRADEDYYSDKYTLQSIDKMLAMGGTYLLNVGPKPDGTFPEENIASLKVIGDWYSSVRESFENTHPASFMVQDDYMGMMGNGTFIRDRIWATKNGNTLYIHLPEGAQSTGLILKPLHVMPSRVTLLNDGRELTAKVDVTPWHWQEPAMLRIQGIPVNEMQGTVMVLKLEFNSDVCE